VAVLELGERDEQGCALVIAHYNYPLRFRSCGPKASLGEPAGVVLSLHPPLMGFCPPRPLTKEYPFLWTHRLGYIPKNS